MYSRTIRVVGKQVPTTHTFSQSAIFLKINLNIIHKMVKGILYVYNNNIIVSYVTIHG